MEETQPAQTVAATFPDPPPFYRFFTPSNLQKLKTLRAANPESNSKNVSPVASTLPVRVPYIPAELQCLQAPELPTSEGKFRCFGDVYYVKENLPTLQDMGVEQVYTPPATPSGSDSPSEQNPVYRDRALILKRLAKSLLLNFLELVAVMAKNSSQWQEKVQDIRTLSINFHHLLNEYRPHQARETLILMMREQLENRRAEIRAARKCKERVEAILEDIGKIELSEESTTRTNPKVEVEKIIYEALVKEFE